MEKSVVFAHCPQCACYQHHLRKEFAVFEVSYLLMNGKQAIAYQCPMCKRVKYGVVVDDMVQLPLYSIVYEDGSFLKDERDDWKTI